MRRLIAAFACILAVAACAPGDGAEAQNGASRDRAEIEAIVRAYILENPEIIEEALVELQRRAREREQQAIIDAVAANADRLTGDSRDPSAGAETPDVTIVEFFDYRCPYCTMTNPWIQQVLADHGDRVRVVFKEFPVRGAASDEAARAALAVWDLQPSAYLGFHDALISVTGPLPTERIDELAAEAGVDVAAMREAMESEAITAHLADINELAREMGVRGTPFFIVGDEIIPGADMAGLERALTAALEG